MPPWLRLAHGCRVGSCPGCPLVRDATGPCGNPRAAAFQCRRTAHCTILLLDKRGATSQECPQSLRPGQQIVGVDILTDCEIFILHLLAIFAAVEPEGKAMLVGPDPVLKGCYLKEAVHRHHAAAPAVGVPEPLLFGDGPRRTGRSTTTPLCGCAGGCAPSTKSGDDARAGLIHSRTSTGTSDSYA
jgi:hypothetical protein